MYVISVNGKEVKRYEHWEQALSYCMLSNYIYSGTGTDEWNEGFEVTALDPKVTIKKEEN